MVGAMQSVVGERKRGGQARQSERLLTFFMHNNVCGGPSFLRNASRGRAHVAEEPVNGLVSPFFAESC